MSWLDGRFGPAEGCLAESYRVFFGPAARVAVVAVLVVWLVTGRAEPGLGAEADPETAALRPLPGGTRLVVEMRPQAEVAGSVVHLGDVVAFVAGDQGLWQRIEDLEVGAAPLPGQSRALSRPVILQRLRQARLNPALVEWATPVEVSVVTAAGVAVDEGLVARAIREHLASAASAGEAGGIRLEAVEVPQGVLVPPGPMEAVVVSGPPVIRPGAAVFAVDVMVNGAPQRRIWVRTSLAQVSSGVEGGSGTLPSADPAAPFEAASVSFVSAGVAAGAGPAVQPPGPEGTFVVRGTPLTVLVRRGAVTVTVTATSLEAARVGERVRVQNAASGAVLQAVLVRPDVAVVDGASQP